MGICKVAGNRFGDGNPEGETQKAKCAATKCGVGRLVPSSLSRLHVCEHVLAV